MLCKRHSSGIKPAIQYFRYTVHILATLRTLDRHRINIWSVKFYLCCLWITGLFCQLSTASDALSVSARTLPDVKWSTPVTVTGNCPVLNVFQPVSETSGTDGFRNPVNSVVIADQIILYCSLFDVPGLSCIINQRLVTSPAVWILMFKLRSIKQLLSGT